MKIQRINGRVTRPWIARPLSTVAMYLAWICRRVTNCPSNWARPNLPATRQKIPNGASFISSIMKFISASLDCVTSSLIRSTFLLIVVSIPANTIEKTIKGSKLVSTALANKLSVTNIKTRFSRIFVTLGVSGSPAGNSSNTLALAKLATESGCPQVFRVNLADELPDDLTGVVGVTAGASAAEKLMIDTAAERTAIINAVVTQSEALLAGFQTPGADGMMIGNYLTTSGRDEQVDLQMIKDAEVHIEA